MSELDTLAKLAKGWDAGYDAAVATMTGALFRLVAEGPKALDSIQRPANPYRLGGSK